MQAIKELHLDEIGAVTFHKVRGSKRVIIRVPPFRPVRVTVPYQVSLKKALAFVQRNVDWIRQQQALTRRLETRSEPLVACMHSLNVAEAKRRLKQRLTQLADEHGFGIGRVTIRHQKTRWGSCSYRNNINLNIQLACLPSHLQDYVMLHELAHTVVKNHGPDFWHLLNRYVPNAKRVQAELRQYPIIDREILSQSEPAEFPAKPSAPERAEQLAFQFDCAANC